MTNILTVIENIQDSSISNCSDASAADFVSALITVMNKIIMKTFDDEYYAAFSLIISVSCVESLDIDATQIVLEIGIENHNDNLEISN